MFKYLLILVYIALVFSGCQSSGNNNDKPSSYVDENITSDDSNESDDEDISEDENTTVIDDSNTSSNDDNTTSEDTNSSEEESEEECENTYSDDMLQGKELYDNHCSVCHASDAKSGLFDIRGSVVAEIDAAMLEVVNMIDMDLDSKVSHDERVLISMYLVELRNNPDVEFAESCEDNNITKESLGNKLFFDKTLSLRENLSCSSCHNPANAFSDARFKTDGDPNSVDGAFSLGDDNVTLGGRNAPALTYAKFVPEFSQNTNGEYIGGMFHDGRAANLKEQSKGPILDQSEMMMVNAQSVIDRVLQNGEYVEYFKALYGENIFDDTTEAYDALAESIASFEKTELFSPFDSKYDRSKLDSSDSEYYSMSEQERLGYELFFDANRTKCVLCHSINSTSESTNEVFTNFKYDNIGVPKNVDALIVRDGDSDKTDLGLGGRADINDTQQYGKVRIPSLRNIAVTGPYMSNGVFKELRTVLEFYNHVSDENDISINPETNTTWADPEVSLNINHTDLAMDSKLTDSELDSLEAFLKLLTDKQYESLLDLSSDF